MFRRVFMLAAIAGAGMFVARKLGIVGGGDDEPIEYVPEPPPASADGGEQQGPGE